MEFSLCVTFESEPPKPAAQADQLCVAWQRLCEQYLPLTNAQGLWRYSRVRAPHDPEQGWKLHLSATILNASQILERIAPVLHERGVRFKAPTSLLELRRLNTGLQYGYSQVGKCFTVYPRTTAEALELAEILHDLTAGFSAPAVPFDSRLRLGSNVFYRYGAFQRLTLLGADGTSTPALRTPAGTLVPDERTNAEAKPAWLANPFPPVQPASAPPTSPLRTAFRVCRALTQRGKGGVYLALDVRVQPAQWCVLKEGRKHGELNWDGCDGHWRVRHEAQVLAQLRDAGLEVPRVSGTFEVNGNFYLVTEFIAGENLQDLLARRQRRLALPQALRYGSEVAAFLAALHAAGWVWRDCKPANLIRTAAGRLRPLDFEGACLVEKPALSAWSSPAFASPTELSAHAARSSIADDLYALGALLYFLLAGRTPAETDNLALTRLRRGLPASVSALVESLLQAPPAQRPSARFVAQQLDAARLNLAASN